MQFQKDTCPYLRQLLHQARRQEQTQELKLTEGMPDVGRVLGAWGQVLIRGKEWRSGQLSVSGGVMAWVLYEPEGGGAPQSVDCWLPFQMKWELPDTDRDGFIRVSPLLSGIDCRSTSARKLMVRAVVSLLAEAWLGEEGALYTPEQLPEDVRLLKKAYEIKLPSEAGEKAFSLEEELEIPAGREQPEKLIRWLLQPELTDKKVMGDKVVFRGLALLQALYLGESGKLCSHQWELPFSQYAELDKEYDADAALWITPAVTSLELEQEEGKLRLKAGILCQYVVCRHAAIEVVADAYSPQRQIQLQTEELELPMILEENRRTVRSQVAMEQAGKETADVSFCMDHGALSRSENPGALTLSGQFQWLGYGPEERLESETVRWQESLPLDAGTQFQVYPTGMPQAEVTQLRADLALDTAVHGGSGILMVTALEPGEPVAPDPGRSSLILKRAGTQSLWQLAKEHGSTVESIKAANGLAGEPDPGQMLLIPVQ